MSQSCFGRVIGVDIRKLHDTGIGQYIRNIYQRIIKADPETEYLFFCNPADAGFEPFSAPNTRFIPNMSKKYGLAEHYTLAVQAAQNNITLFHTPHYVYPYFLKNPGVVTIHDITHLRVEQGGLGFAKKALAKKLLDIAVNRSKAILTVSEFSKRDILREWPGLPPEKITVTLNGVSPIFAPQDSGMVAEALAEKKLHAGYILFVGSAKPHKNAAGMVQAYNILRASMPDAPELVLVGVEESEPGGSLRGPGIRFFGNTEIADLPKLYDGAGVFVMPSFYEGFGLPVLEAMACGTPVVSSDRTSLPEVAGGAALLADPSNPGAFAQAIKAVLTDKILKGKLVELGLERVKSFSWDTTAARTLELFNRIAAMKGQAGK